MPFPLIAAIAASAPTWLPAAATVGSSLIGGLFSNQAAGAQQGAINAATDEQRREYDITRGLLEPAITAGNTARGYQLGALGLPGGVSYDDVIRAFHTSPGYEFSRNAGINAAQGSAAAGGTLFSGKTLKDLTRFGTGLADQEFGDYYGRLGGLSGAGQNAVGGLVSAGQNTAANVGNLLSQGGDARASSYLRGANLITSGIQNLADLAAYGGRGGGGGAGRPGSAVPGYPGMFYNQNGYATYATGA